MNMARVNKKASKVSPKLSLTSYDLLRRSVMTSLLWEDQFYEDGITHAERIKEYMNDVSKEEAISILEEAKFSNKLRHTPLYLMTLMAKKGYLTSEEVAKIITRVDDMSELIALYNSDEDNKKMLPHCLTKGIAKAFTKFDEYQFSKYKGTKDKVKLRDVIRVAHPKPSSDEQSLLWKKIIDNSLATPDTWEVELSKSTNKNESWTRLLTEKTDKGFSKLPSLALLRNMRNIINANVDSKIVKEAIRNMDVSKILPYQFITSSKYAPLYSEELEKKFLECTSNMEKLPGSTIILLDASGSMEITLSRKSSTTRGDVAVALGAIAKEICEEAIIYRFNTNLSLIPSNVKGFSLINEYKEGRGGTAVKKCAKKAIKLFKKANMGRYPTRVIVITDEQTNSDYITYNEPVRELENLPKCSHGYLINVGAYEKGIDYTKHSGWTTISGWSENILKYISSYEEMMKKQ